MTGFDPPFGPSGTAHRGGSVPDPGATAGTTKMLFEDGAFKTGPIAFPMAHNDAVIGARGEISLNDSSAIVVIAVDDPADGRVDYSLQFAGPILAIIDQTGSSFVT